MQYTYNGKELATAPNSKGGLLVSENSFYSAVASLDSPRYFYDYDYDASAHSSLLVQYLRKNGFEPWDHQNGPYYSMVLIGHGVFDEQERPTDSIFN